MRRDAGPLAAVPAVARGIGRGTTRSMRRRAGALAAVLAVALPLVWANPAATAQEAVLPGAVEARVGAKWLPDGRVEFALQVLSGGVWGSSLLPHHRLMPAGRQHSRWLSTSPIVIEGAEVRVAARRLADGVVSVALRGRSLPGGWGERQLPQRHLLYANRQSGLWTWSSPAALDPVWPQVVAFYGHPGVRAMGVLGHGTPAEVAGEVAAWTERYDRLNGRRGVLGAYHLITGVAQANPTSDGHWLYRLSHDRIAAYVEAARENGMLLFLDNQIGWSDPLSEVRLLEEFLREPFVHMALDPEFATKPLGVRPGLAIGGITGEQVNEVLLYLSELVETEGLPPKILMVHQFAGRMLHDREVIVTQPGVELSIDMDGIGSPSAKLFGYRLYAITEPSQRPAFKLFFHQDSPLISPEEVLAMDPVPDVILYQ